MADLDSIGCTLLETVSQILVNETRISRDARAYLESLKGDLQIILNFLRHSGWRDDVKEKVKKFRVGVLNAENFIDDFGVKMTKHKTRNPLMRFLHDWELRALLRVAAAYVNQIRSEFDLILESREEFSITSEEGAKKSIIQSRRLNVEMYDVVCFENEAESVIKMLDTQYLQKGVVSIIGMGGLGKTTLARKIFNGYFVKNFDCVAWVNVSQDYNLEDLLKKIANDVLPKEEMEEFNKLEKESSPEEGNEKLVHMLKTGLAGKRYFIVLDDVWKKRLWDEIKAALPENGKKSRVLITSRSQGVAQHASTPSSTYSLPFLNDDDSWKLFSRKAFRDQDYPPQCEISIREKILTKCKGLPLTIVVVAGLLRKTDQTVWSEVADNLSSHIAQDPTYCLDILALSYEELPPYLKPCFLYFGVYPEDFEIQVKNLIRLWVAEGFIYKDNETNSDIEDEAEKYLLELIDRSLIQVASKRADGGVKTCRIHNLLRDFSISEGKREMFLSVDRKQDGSLPLTKPRRLSVHLGSRDLRYDYLSMFSLLRSLLSFGDDDDTMIDSNNDPFNHLYEFCRYLRVLDLGSARYYNFPPKVEMLAQLRYLRMNALGMDEIPSCISKLVNLQTLDVRSVYATSFMSKLWEMQQLRHLNLYGWTRIFIPKGNGIKELPNLRTLSSIGLYSKDEAEILKMFPNLKTLKVVCGDDDLGVFEYLGKLQRLQTLTIRSKFRFTDPRALPLSLTKVTLYETYLDTSGFSKLGWLPNLQVLKLKFDSFSGRKLENDNDQEQFPKLKVLIMRSLDIKYWSIEGQGFQSLVHLSIINCHRLKAIPDQLKQLSSLRQLQVNNCHALMNSLRQKWVNDARLIINRRN